MKTFKKIIALLIVATMCLTTLASCGKKSGKDKDDGKCRVTFNLCTELKTNAIKEQVLEVGSKVSKPVVIVVGDNVNNESVVGWYKDSAYVTEWNFATDTVEKSMTLYAKWICGYNVNYYVGDATTPRFTEAITSGKLASEHREVADGYEILGYYTSSSYKYEFDFTKPITKETNIYVKTGESIYVSAEALSRRCSSIAAEQVEGASAGGVSYNSDGDYAEFNFGNTPSGNGRILLSGVELDISASQKIEICFRYLGKSDAVKFYWITKYADGEWTNGYHNAGEDRSLKYYYTPDDYETSKDGWVTKTFDFSEASVKDGVSAWANSKYLTSLFFQTYYHTEDKEDYSDIMQVKYVKGVKDLTYVIDPNGTLDREKVDASSGELESAANAQTSVNGWIFPKNNANATANDEAVLYKKQNGLAIYAPYRHNASSVTLEVPSTCEEGISLDDYTTMRFKLRNYGYASSITVTYENQNGRSASFDLAIDKQMREFKEYEVSLAGATNYKGMLNTITITYTSTGIDNFILFESIIFAPFKAVQTSAINFHDPANAGFTSTSDVELTWNKQESATNFNVKTTGSAIEREYTKFAINGYKTVTMNYKNANGIDKVTLTLTVDGEAKSYEFIPDGENNAKTFDLKSVGNMTKAEITFSGVGSIDILNFNFGLDKELSVDFSNTAYFTSIEKDWMESCSYIINLSAVKWTQGDSIACYLGYMQNRTGNKNIALKGHSKIYVIYQNTGSATSMALSFGLVDSTKNASYLTAIAYPSGNAYGKSVFAGIESNMAADEWCAVEFDISGERNGVTLEDRDNWYMTMIELVNEGDFEINIRAIIVE